MNNCRFCDIAKLKDNEHKPENSVFAQTDKYFAISSIGALVEGWTLVVPKEHCCSMKEIYKDVDFEEFVNSVIAALTDSYGPIIAFEHGPNRQGSETSCGTDHAHIHLVPFHSLSKKLDKMNLLWMPCYSSEVSNIVQDNEYLFYVDVETALGSTQGRIHILEHPISQFFRKVIADDLGVGDKYNYKINPDTELTLKTIDRMSRYFAESNGG